VVRIQKARIRLRTELGGVGSSTETQPLNIGYLHKGSINWVVAHPLLLRWDGMRWEPRRAMKNRSMITLEARIFSASAVESVNCQDFLLLISDG